MPPRPDHETFAYKHFIRWSAGQALRRQASRLRRQASGGQGLRQGSAVG